MVTKLKAKSMNDYFEKRCTATTGNQNNKDFWNAIKPFISSKMKNENTRITLLDDSDKLVNDPSDVCELFNEFFSDVAKGIGFSGSLTKFKSMNEIDDHYKDHKSIKLIHEYQRNSKTFTFSHVDSRYVYKLIQTLDTNKATGFDQLPSKLIKLAGESLCIPLSNMINLSISESNIPNQLKMAEVSPLYKAKDTLRCNNYRPVSILSSTSRLFERVFFKDLYEFFNDLLSKFISAFRRKYGCQHVLTRMLNDCKAALDRMEYVGLVMIDLSKAFDCIPHSLLQVILISFCVSIES